MSTTYFAAALPVPPAGEVTQLVEPADVERTVIVQERPVGPTPESARHRTDETVTWIDLNPEMDGDGFRLPSATFELTLPAGHGLHAAVSEQGVLASIEVLVTPR